MTIESVGLTLCIDNRQAHVVWKKLSGLTDVAMIDEEKDGVR